MGLRLELLGWVLAFVCAALLWDFNVSLKFVRHGIGLAWSCTHCVDGIHFCWAHIQQNEVPMVVAVKFWVHDAHCATFDE